MFEFECCAGGDILVMLNRKRLRRIQNPLNGRIVRKAAIHDVLYFLQAVP